MGRWLEDPMGQLLAARRVYANHRGGHTHHASSDGMSSGIARLQGGAGRGGNTVGSECRKVRGEGA